MLWPPLPSTQTYYPMKKSNNVSKFLNAMLRKAFVIFLVIFSKSSKKALATFDFIKEGQLKWGGCLLGTVFVLFHKF